MEGFVFFLSKPGVDPSVYVAHTVFEHLQELFAFMSFGLSILRGHVFQEEVNLHGPDGRRTCFVHGGFCTLPEVHVVRFSSGTSSCSVGVQEQVGIACTSAAFVASVGCVHGLWHGRIPPGSFAHLVSAFLVWLLRLPRDACLPFATPGVHLLPARKKRCRKA